MSFGAKTTKVQVMVKPEWCPQGQMLVINAEMIELRFGPLPYIEEEGPTKIILVPDEREAFRIREAVNEVDGMELWEADDAA